MTKRGIVQAAAVLAGIMLAMVAIHLVNSLTGGGLDTYGVRPRHIDSLPGILTAPWIHADWTHLGNNLAGLSIFGALAMVDGVRRFVAASAIMITVSGLLLWLLGRDAMHIGASGWIFGLWSLAIMRAWFDRRPVYIIICILVIVLYGGMGAGLLPTRAAISFEGHVFGAAAGVLVAYLWRRRPALAPAAPPPTVRFWN